VVDVVGCFWSNWSGTAVVVVVVVVGGIWVWVIVECGVLMLNTGGAVAILSSGTWVRLIVECGFCMVYNSPRSKGLNVGNETADRGVVTSLTETSSIDTGAFTISAAATSVPAPAAFKLLPNDSSMDVTSDIPGAIPRSVSIRAVGCFFETLFVCCKLNLNVAAC